MYGPAQLEYDLAIGNDESDALDDRFRFRSERAARLEAEGGGTG